MKMSWKVKDKPVSHTLKSIWVKKFKKKVSDVLIKMTLKVKEKTSIRCLNQNEWRSLE